MSTYRDALERYLSNLDVEAGCVMDVGGAQLPVAGRVKSWRVNEYFIVDLPDPHEVKAAADIAFDLSRDVYHHGPLADVLFCLEVMEYVHDPAKAVANLRSMLKKDGTLYITFPQLYPPHNPAEADCLRYTRRGCVKLLSEAGFLILNVTSRDLKPDSAHELRQIVRREGLKLAHGYEHELESMGYIIEAVAV